MEKHSHYQEQLELSHQKLQHVEALGDQEHIRKTQEKYNTLAEKTREIGYKVRRRANLSSSGLTSDLPKWIGNKTMLKVVRKCSYEDERKLGALLFAMGGWNLLAGATWLLLHQRQRKYMFQGLNEITDLSTGRPIRPPLLQNC